ncbi:MAG: glycosyltransferase family 39 protein [Gemmataceae bacterium]
MSPSKQSLDNVWVWRVLACGLIVGVAILRFIYLAYHCELDLAPDEAHYWDWTRKLDWSYYSKGPLVAYIIRLSCFLFGPLSEQLVGSEMLAVRLPAIVCGSLFLVGVYVLVTLVCQRESLAWLSLLILLPIPVLSAGATLMTIDAPYSCCWVWAVVFGYLALFRRQPIAWVGAGLTVGLGLLAKYTMVLWLPSLGIFLLTSPKHRVELCKPGFWVASLLIGLSSLPIIIWNWQHDWISFHHVKHVAGLRDSSQRVYWYGPLLFIGIQFGLLMGLWFVVWTRSMLYYAPWKRVTPQHSYLWWMSAVTFLVFFSFGFTTKGGKANWAVMSYIAGIPLCVGWLAHYWKRSGSFQRSSILAWSIAVSLLGLALTIHIHKPSWSYPVLVRIAGEPTPRNPTPLRRVDPTCRLRGWQFLASEVDHEVRKLRKQGIEPIVASGSWSVVAELSFYGQETKAIYYFGVPLGCRHTQYDLWEPNPVKHPDMYRGRTVIFVGMIPDKMLNAFDSIDNIRKMQHHVNGGLVAEWYISQCHGYQGFPDQLSQHGLY